MSKEELSKGNVPLSTYSWFFSKGGNFWLVLMIIFSVGGKFSDVLAQYKLTSWNEASLTSVMTTGSYLGEKENLSYVTSFALLKIVLTIAGVFRYTFACALGVKAGQRIHKDLSHSILSAPIAFFDTTPQGRILNRFSVDIGNLDNSLSPIVAIAIASGADFAGAIGAMLYSTGGSFIIILLPFMYCYYLFQVGYSKTNIQLKRLESNFRSPVLSQFTELVNGLSSVRAFNVDETFRKKMTIKVEDLNVVDTVFQYSQNWIQIRFDMLGGIIIFALYALTIESNDFISASDLAVGQLYAQSFSGIVSMIVILMAQIQSSFNSVERVKSYISDITPEETDEVKEVYEEIRDTWPENGKIVFNDIDMGYRDGPSVLKGIYIFLLY
jgi:ABC-type multidrug transport system fused ATPase/permease subunit